MCDLTREGNKIIPADSVIREHIKGNSNTICAACKHVEDLCNDIWKQKSTFNGYTEITKCSGFEDVSDV